jgi:hypothetical protein
MDRSQLLQECDRAVSELLSDLPRPEQKSVAALLEGIVVERTAVLTRAAAAAPGEAADRSKQRRAQRLLANPRFDVPRAQRRLVQRILAHPRPRLDLLVDAITTGATATQPGTRALRTRSLAAATTKKNSPRNSSLVMRGCCCANHPRVKNGRAVPGRHACHDRG